MGAAAGFAIEDEPKEAVIPCCFALKCGNTSRCSGCDSSASEWLAAQVHNSSDVSVVFPIATLARSVPWQFLFFISV